MVYPKDNIARALIDLGAKENVPLSELVSFRVGGPAAFVLQPKEEGLLGRALDLCRAEQIPVILLGNGTNVLPSDEGFSGLILQLSGDGSAPVFEGEKVTVGAGCSLTALAKESVQRGLMGLERLCGIPGTVGGAVAMNAGAYGGEIKNVLKRVRCYREGGFVWEDARLGEMGYRKSPYTWPKTVVTIRRKRAVEDETIERYSVIRSLAAVRRADVVLIVVDAEQGLSEQDVKIAGYVHEEGKPSVLVVNKWDLIEKDTNTMNKFKKDMQVDLAFMDYVPFLFISAKTGQRVNKLLAAAKESYAQSIRRITTGTLNDIVNEAISMTEPPAMSGKRLKIYYATEVSVQPPTFVFFVNDEALVHFSYRRYMENYFRKTFGFAGTPLYDAGADLLLYGMGERSIVALAEALDAGTPIRDIRTIPGSCYQAAMLDGLENYVTLPSYQEVSADKKKYAQAFMTEAREQDAVRGRTLVQAHEKGYLVCNPPSAPLSREELDAVYALPFTRRPHPMYEQPIPGRSWASPTRSIPIPWPTGTRGPSASTSAAARSRLRRPWSSLWRSSIDSKRMALPRRSSGGAAPSSRGASSWAWRAAAPT